MASRKKTPTKQQLAAWIAEGVPISAMARQLNMSRPGVHYHLEKHGLKSNAQRGKRSDAGAHHEAAPKAKPKPTKPDHRPDVPDIEPLFSTYRDEGTDYGDGTYFDEEAATKAVRWIEQLRHFKGRWAGRRFLLMKWQIRLVRAIFGWKTADGFRLYRMVYVEAPRKSGKTSLAAAIALYLAHEDGEAAPEVYFAAYDRDQARIAYDAAQHMTEQDPELMQRTRIYISTHTMELKDNPGGFMKTLSRETAKQFGLNIQALIFDELMTQKSREMWNAVTTSEASREQPLIFGISTAGWDIQSICFEQHARTESIANGDTTDDTFLGVVFGAPMDADWTDEAVWRAANPSYGETAGTSFYERKAREAKNQPTEQNAFRTLLLSQWVGQAERYIDMEVWDGNRAKPSPPAKRPAFGGLDLSTTTDMTAFLVVAEHDGLLDVFPHVYLPEAKLNERERRDRAPYGVWAEQGLLTLTPGAVVDYGFVRNDIVQSQDEFDLRDISYDRWNSSQLVAELEDEGFTMVKIGQGFAGLSSPTKELLRLAVSGNLRHGGHPILRWCANAMSVSTDPAGNVKPDKSQSSQKIDPIVALIMAVDGWARRGRELGGESPYDKYDLAVAGA